jgi:hypothetical protein
VWRLIDGWLVLMKEVDKATTFDGLYASGEKFGDTMGEKAARAFIMLGTVALGNTASGMAATLPKLPGAGQAAVVAETQLGIRFTAPALAQVESVAITTEGVTIALAPNAVAMAARDTSGGKAGAQAAPPSSGGPGKWVQVDESMSESARTYQAQRTGAPRGYAYRVKVGDEEVDFDGFDQGVLLEIKATGYAQWIDKQLNFLKIFEGRHKLLDQATRQCGDSSLHLHSSCVLNPFDEGPARERILTTLVMTEVLRAMALAWDPEWGVVTSHQYDDLVSEKVMPAGTSVGWVMYFSRLRGKVPPCLLPCASSLWRTRAPSSSSPPSYSPLPTRSTWRWPLASTSC